MKSIQKRLSLSLALILIVVGLLLIRVSGWLFDESSRFYLSRHLESHAKILLLAFDSTLDGLHLDTRKVDSVFNRPYSGIYYRIDAGTETWRSRSLWDADLPVGSKGLQKKLTKGPSHQKLLVFSVDYQRYGYPITITIAQNYTAILQSVRHVERVAFSLGLATLLFILLLQRMVIRQALAPLNVVREQIIQLQKGQRVELSKDVPKELSLLVSQINHLLIHTENSLKRSRNSVGNLGHALKTPLAVLFSLTEKDDFNRLPVIQKNIRENLKQIQNKLERELAYARIAGDSLTGEHFDCNKEIPQLLMTLSMIHSRGLDLKWSVDTPELYLPWDREDLLEVLGNLLDNACKWAKNHVQLSIRSEENSYQLVIEDDGPGILQAHRHEVMTRGYRLDEQAEGHGLGLGIVRDIVSLWKGSIVLDDSKLGGLKVNVSLPKVL